MGRSVTKQKALTEARSRVSLVLSTCSLAFCFVAIYFTQYATIQNSLVTTLAVSASMLLAFFGTAVLSFFLPLKLRDFVITLAILIAARYIVFSNLIGLQATIVNVIMGLIFGLSALGASVTTTYTSLKNAQLSIILGFIGAAALTLAFKLFLPFPYVIMQEICLIIAVTFLALFAILNMRESVPYNASSIHIETYLDKRRCFETLLPNNSGRLIVVYALLLLFCFGVFEAYASTNEILSMGSNEVVFTVFCLGLVVLYIYNKKKSDVALKHLNWLLAAAFVVFVCISSIVLYIEALPPEFFFVMGVVSILVHIFIWLHCIQSSIKQRIPSSIFFGIFLGFALAAHRSGWLLTTCLTTLLGGEGVLVSKLGATTLAIMAIVAAVVIAIREKKRETNSKAQTQEDDSAARFQDFCMTNDLTEREGEILLLYYRGRSIPHISEKLCISENTVKTHIRHIYEKTGIRNKQEIIDSIEKLALKKR